MAKKSTNDLVGLVAFASMVIAAGLFLLSRLDLDLGSVGALLDKIALICAYIAVAFAAFFYVSKRDLIWQIIYWAIVIVFVITNFL